MELTKTLANLPDVRRGYGYQMYANGKKGDRITYCNGVSAFIRDIEDPTIATAFSEHKAKVNVSNFSPSGHYVASGDSDGRIIVWGDKNQNIKSDFPINKEICDIVWDPDGKRIVAAGDGAEHMAKVFTWDTGSALGSITGHLKTILSVDYRPVRPFRVISGGEDFTQLMHEGPPFKPLNTKSKKEHSNYVNKLKFSPDGSKYVSVSSDQKICAYDGTTGDLLKTMEKGHTASIYSFAWSPDGAKILTCGADKTAKIWDYESGEVEKTFTFGTTLNDMQMCALWHKEYMLTVSLSGAINYLDPDNESTPKQVIHGHVAPISSVVVDHAKNVFYTADTVGVLSVWKNNLAQWFTGAGHKKAITAIALNFDGSKIVSVGFDDKLRINDTASAEFATDAHAVGGTPSCVDCGSKTDGLIAVGIGQGKILMMKGGETNLIPTDEKPMTLQFHPTEEKLAVGFAKGGVKVYKVDGLNLTVAEEYKDLKRKVNKVEWSPCGTYLVCGGDEKRILVYKEGKEENINKTDWEFHNASVCDFSWSPDGKMVASVGADLTVRIWKDTEKFTAKRDQVLMAHRVGINKVAWLDNNTVMSLGKDSCSKIWTVA